MRPKRETIDSELQKAERAFRKGHNSEPSRPTLHGMCSPSLPASFFGCAMGALPTTSHSDFARTAPRLEASRVILNTSELGHGQMVLVFANLVLSRVSATIHCQPRAFPAQNGGVGGEKYPVFSCGFRVQSPPLFHM